MLIVLREIIFGIQRQADHHVLPVGPSEEKKDSPFLDDLRRMILAIRTRSKGWTELCRSLGAKHRNGDIPKMEAEMQTIPKSEFRAGIVAVMDLLQRQSSVSEQELLAGLSACALLAIDGRRQTFAKPHERISVSK